MSAAAMAPCSLPPCRPALPRLPPHLWRISSSLVVRLAAHSSSWRASRKEVPQKMKNCEAGGLWEGQVRA